MFDIEDLKEYRDYLQYLADGGRPHKIDRGVCSSFYLEFNSKLYDGIPGYYEIIELFEYYSRDEIYCIQGITDDPYGEYWETENLWTGEYGRRRRLFCGLLADHLDEFIWTNLLKIKAERGTRHEPYHSYQKRSWL